MKLKRAAALMLALCVLVFSYLFVIRERRVEIVERLVHARNAEHQMHVARKLLGALHVAV